MNSEDPLPPSIETLIIQIEFSLFFSFFFFQGKQLRDFLLLLDKSKTEAVF